MNEERTQHDSDFQVGEPPTTINDYLSLLSAYIVDYLPDECSNNTDDEAFDKFLIAWERQARVLLEPLFAKKT